MWSSQTSPGPASLRGQAELITCVTLLGTALPYQNLPFWTLCFSSKHCLLLLYLYRISIAYIRKVRKTIVSVCMMCTRTFPCECVHLHTCEINEQPHMYVLTLAMWDGVLPAAVCQASWPVPVPSPLRLSEPRSSCLCDSLCHWAITSAPRAEIFFISFLALRI